MTGIILMIIGVLIFAFGIIIYLKSNGKEEMVSNDNELEKVIEMAIADGVLTSNEKKLIEEIAIEKSLDYEEIIASVENKIALSANDSETEIIDYNKKNGDDFEKFVAQKFDKKYFRIKEWAGDKYINGVYADTTPQPDLLLEFSFKQKTTVFSVECKWRRKFYKNGIEFANMAQFERYKNFERKQKIPVFIAIGIGGKAISPENLYVVPLKDIDNNFILKKELNKYEKKVNSGFFFNADKKELR